MPDWSQIGNGTLVENGNAQAAASRGGTITANATANTKAATWNQLIAATSFDTVGVMIMFDDCTANIDYLVDIAVGGSGAEIVIIDNILVSAGATGSLTYGGHYYFPLRIPKGTRVSARCQSGATGSNVVRICALFIGGNMMASAARGKVTTYGANTTTSGGVSIDPGATANTKPAFPATQIVAATTYAMVEMLIVLGNQRNLARSSASWLLDICIGASGSEQILFPNIALNSSTSPDTLIPLVIGPLPVDIPAGTRLSARAQCTDNVVGTRTFDLVIYGVS